MPVRGSLIGAAGCCAAAWIVAISCVALACAGASCGAAASGRGFGFTERSISSMRERTSGASADLEMKSLAPAWRARLWAAWSWLPEITITGSLRMRSSLAPRTRRSRPKPSSFGMSRSENTITIELSSWIVFQAASPSTASRTTKLDLRMRLNVVRTNFESSTMSTRFSAVSVAFPIESFRAPQRATSPVAMD